METTISSLKRNHKKLFVVDEKYWDNVEFMVFHSCLLEIKLKRGRPTNILHNWVYENVESTTDTEDKLDFYKYHNCSYRFPKDNAVFLNYLYREAEKRKLRKPYGDKIYG